MHIPSPHPNSRGFTLIEVLASLGLCALLAASIASAIAFSGRAEQLAAREGDASLLLPSLYAAQRLRPDDLIEPPPSWRVDVTSEFLPLPDGTLREWSRLTLASAARDLTPVTFRIMDDTP